MNRNGLTARYVVAVVLALACACACVSAWASGAPWFRWKNTVNHTTMCSQISPGSVWEKIPGPYMESRCRKPGMPQ